MNDTPDQEGQSPQPAAPTGPAIRVLAQYVKDLSFENPSPLTSGGGQAPAIDLGIDVKADAHPGQANAFEVTLRLSAQAKREDKVVFIAELVYAGLFELHTDNQAEIEPILLVECPRLLFPFARRLVAEAPRGGGYPPLLIDPVDFIGLYRQQKANAAAQNQAASAQPLPNGNGDA